MKGVHSVLCIVCNQLIRDEEGFMCVGSANSVQSEAAGKTGDRTEQTFEGLGHVMRYEVLVYLKTM